mmetsp:Transcript_20391/g.39405  ORF Transcript_20391/g.39405 Transcript_20391/m.39405 type:complete len:484 (-) Transcript_20391:390-1841(-)
MGNNSPTTAQKRSRQKLAFADEVRPENRRPHPTERDAVPSPRVFADPKHKREDKKEAGSVTSEGSGMLGRGHRMGEIFKRSENTAPTRESASSEDRPFKWRPAFKKTGNSVRNGSSRPSILKNSRNRLTGDTSSPPRTKPIHVSLNDHIETSDDQLTQSKYVEDQSDDDKRRSKWGFWASKEEKVPDSPSVLYERFAVDKDDSAQELSKIANNENNDLPWERPANPLTLNLANRLDGVIRAKPETPNVMEASDDKVTFDFEVSTARRSTKFIPTLKVEMPPLSDWLDTKERDTYRRRFLVCDTSTGMLEILPREGGKPLRILSLINATVEYDYSYKSDPRVLCVKFLNDTNELRKLVLHHEDWERVRHWARYLSRFIDLLKEEEIREAAEGFMSTTFMGSSMFDLKKAQSHASTEVWKPWKVLRDMAIYDSPDLFNSMGGPGVEIGDIVYARKVRNLNHRSSCNHVHAWKLKGGAEMASAEQL